jgi:DNA repair protein RadA/Sms
MGRCPECEAWNSFQEEIVAPKAPTKGAKAPPGPVVLSGRPQRITEVTSLTQKRLSTRLGELDRVLGGGIVPGSLVLVGGDPGIGKSTLLTQVAHHFSQDHGPVLYVSGEESAEQIRLRADRLAMSSPNLYLLGETDILQVEGQVDQLRPACLLIDSIQTMYTPESTSSPGTVSQVRHATQVLMRMAKTLHLPVFIVGHVTKEGAIAGPRVLEHMVDTVLYFEGERGHTYRLLRAVKNRFGSTNEVGIFEMAEEGLLEVPNPSEYLLAERSQYAPGSAVTATVEGTRPLLVEVQALAVPTQMVAPRRVTTGLDASRTHLLLAVLEKRAGVRCSTQEVYVNVAGGVRVVEPATDLGVALAVASSVLEAPVPPDTVMAGEVGLAGEVRAVGQMEKRLAEAARLGFRRAVIPRRNITPRLKQAGMDVVPVESLRQALEVVLGV